MKIVQDQKRLFHKLMTDYYDQSMASAMAAMQLVEVYKDRLQTGMDSDTSEAMAPDEMYLMLQADMVSIKQQEQALQTEIEEISSKFHQLLESVNIDSDGGSGRMAPPSTPSFMKSTSASLTQVTSLETPTFMKTPGKSTYVSISDSSDDESRSFFAMTTDCKIDQIVNETDGLPLDISTLSSKTLIVDSNSNYLDSPHSEHNDNDNDTPVIEAIPTLDHLSPPSTNSSTGSSSSSSHRMSSSSDGYPKSDESTDNQIVPECYDLDKEFMSRLQYYSDFTLDRQRKINSIVSQLCTSSDNSPVKDDITTRHVEGKESSPEKAFTFKKPIVTTVTSGSSSDIVSTPTSRPAHRDRALRHRPSRTGRKRSSRPLASSTMLDNSFSSSSSSRSHRGTSQSLIPKASSTMIFESGSSSSGSRRNGTSGSNPRACSTMLNESFLSSGSAGSGSSRHRSTSIPMANSTMITEQSAILPQSGEPTISIIRPDHQYTSDNDCESVFTWSIHDDNSDSDSRDISLEESFMQHQNKGQKTASNKPPLPPMKRVRSGSFSSRDSDSERVCQDHKLHKLLGEPCSKNIHECISVIVPDQTCAQNAVFVDSMYTDNDGIVPKSNTIPRSSTKIKLQDNSTGSSSMEARRASLPDLTSFTNDDHSVPESSVSEEECTALPERLECMGKSSSSNDNNGVQGNSQGSANIDSILTDSPNSVSSGINAPYNSPGTNISSSSRVSCSTTSDAKSSDSNINTRAPQVNLLPRNIPVDSPKVQNVQNSAQSRNPVFKVPKQNQPLRQLFRFRRKSKTPDMKTSTPKESAPVQSGQTNSKRQLFPSTGTTNLQQQEMRVMDKKAVMRRFKKFSDSIRKTDKTGKPHFETLANL